MKNEALLIARCIEGNRQAQCDLYEQYAGVLYGICLRYAADRAEAEDMLQEGFIRIFANLNQFQAVGSFEGWLKRIVVNTAITYFHRQKRHHYNHEIEENVSDGAQEKDMSDQEFSTEELMLVINGLPAGYKMVFNLYAIEGYKHKEIAAMLNIDVNTSKSQYSRAKKMIQTKLVIIKEKKITTRK